MDLELPLEGAPIREKILSWLRYRFELSRGGSGHNVRSMEGLRGLAVFLVFLVHYATFMHPWMKVDKSFMDFVAAIHTMGNSGVDLFFVLSGYLIYGSLISRDQSFSIFMMRRVKRIYPAFLVVFLIYVLLSIVFREQSKIPSGIGPASLYLVQNLFLLPGLFPIEPIITVAWSLSYEMFYYLLIPLVISMLGMRRMELRLRAVLFAALALLIFCYCAAFGGHVRLIMFISGILLSESISGKLMSPPGSAVALAALIVGLVSTILPLEGFSGYSLKIAILFCSFFVLCFSCFAHPSAWLPKAFSWTPLRWFGNMSYSYYLLHGLALKTAFLFFPVHFPQNAPVLFWGLLPCAFILTLIPTTLLFLFVERPFSLVFPGKSH